MADGADSVEHHGTNGRQYMTVNPRSNDHFTLIAVELDSAPDLRLYQSG
jgi:hypothetical protein